MTFEGDVDEEARRLIDGPIFSDATKPVGSLHRFTSGTARELPVAGGNQSEHWTLRQSDVSWIW